MKVGRRLVLKIFNASKFVLGFDVEASSPSDISEPLDVSMLADLSRVVIDATAELERFDYSRALEIIEDFFWIFCDYYIELVKDRAYADRCKEGSVHRATWPSSDEIVKHARNGNNAFSHAREMLVAIRQFRGNHKIGPKPLIPEMTVRAKPR